MTDSPIHPLETILRRIAASAPAPWYPAPYAQESRIPRDELDAQLDRLRLAGLVQLTDWIYGSGQGYAVTAQGQELLDNPRQLQRWIDGRLDLEPEGQEPDTHLPSGNSPRFDEMVRTFSESSPPVVTWTLITANVIVFVAGIVLAVRQGFTINGYLLNPASSLLLQIGALSGKTLYLNHQWWRLLSSCFVHIGLIHLAVNMYSLYAVGVMLERMWGKVRFVLLYAIAGFVGSCGMLIENPAVVGAGASGAIFGILGSMAGWLILYRSVMPPTLFRRAKNQLTVVLVLNLIITFSVPGISKGAHVGGALAGLILAFPLDYLHHAPASRKWLALLGVFAVPALALVLLQQQLDGRAGFVIREMQQGSDVELFNRYLPDVRSALATGSAAENRCLPLLDQAADQRSAETVARANAELTKAKRKLDDAQQSLERATFYSSRVRMIRTNTFEYFEKERAFLGVLEHALRQNELSGNEQRQLIRARNEMLSARAKWVKELFGEDDQ